MEGAAPGRFFGWLSLSLEVSDGSSRRRFDPVESGMAWKNQAVLSFKANYDSY